MGFIQYKHNPDNLNSLSDNVILSIDEDAEGELWIGTTRGLNKYDRNRFILGLCNTSRF